MIKTSSIAGQSGRSYTVFDFPINNWKEFPVKGIYILTKVNKGSYHEVVDMGEADNISLTLKGKQIVKKAHCLYIIFVTDDYKRTEILGDIENGIPQAKKKLILIAPQGAKAT